ncbi:hypothetical protein JYU34_018546 [Plutella xylostella]|uniref:Uncharacterized protein n=1 Tax=Plutella xylostella TaxID=51655 RepID=A0ABQ7Q1M7_PLUXY|nr:hypothetical protein JYU34_018546 [Plutella xylostella]
MSRPGGAAGGGGGGRTDGHKGDAAGRGPRPYHGTVAPRPPPRTPHVAALSSV